MMHRVQRALTQPIEILEQSFYDDRECFKVKGTKGSEYTVKIYYNKASFCSCPDFFQRNHHCKHILYVLLKHFNIDSGGLRQLQNQPYIGIHDLKQSSNVDGDICPICHDSIDGIQYACHQCCNNFHYDCVSHWLAASRRQNQSPTCPMCRTTTFI